MAFHLVRVGALGHVGRFRSVDATRYPRGARVIVRTPRGLEVGDILAPPGEEPQRVRSDGPILRGMTAQDQLLEARLQKNRLAAYSACTQRLADRGIPATLVDVEHLFDGRGLYFYFLGDVPAEVDALTAELAALYDTEVQFRRFAETLSAGCGPDCGTEHAAGHGCGSCASGCAISSACHGERPA
jgi:cell fate regulator YaaT (PSP1 superfamily)